MKRKRLVRKRLQSERVAIELSATAPDAGSFSSKDGAAIECRELLACERSKVKHAEAEFRREVRSQVRPSTNPSDGGLELGNEGKTGQLLL